MITQSKQEKKEPLFPLGKVVITPGALAVLRNANETVDDLLNRHKHGDWGNVSDLDAAMNNSGIDNKMMLTSDYDTSVGARIWIITEWDRSITTILTPGEY